MTKKEKSQARPINHSVSGIPGLPTGLPRGPVANTPRKKEERSHSAEDLLDKNFSGRNIPKTKSASVSSSSSSNSEFDEEIEMSPLDRPKLNIPGNKLLVESYLS